MPSFVVSKYINDNTSTSERIHAIKRYFNFLIATVVSEKIIAIDCTPDARTNHLNIAEYWRIESPYTRFNAQSPRNSTKTNAIPVSTIAARFKPAK